jgi:isochorismate synthase
VAEGRTLVVVVDAPVALPEALLASTWLPYGTLWAAHVGFGFATAGIARRVVVSGYERLQQLRHEINTTFGALDLRIHASSAPPPVRFFGGLSFAPGSSDPLWGEFGDGAFVLPRWTYAVDGARAFLTLAVSPGQASDLASTLEEFDAITEGLRNTAVPMWAPTISTSRVSQLQLETWVNMLTEARGRLERGEIRKVVLARRSEVSIPDGLRDVTMLMRLRREIPECTRFAFRGLRSTFLGATPELLFSKTGTSIHTEALAGSIRCTGTSPERLAEQTQRLLHNPKDLKEHSIVVEQIVERLRPFFGASPAVPPTTRRFRNIIHLHTPISGRLPPTADAIAVLEALHPTPAVGGVPFLEAARCIVQLEPCQRGWYAGPVGWIDCQGDATFSVGIRSGLLAHPAAYIYAGAGIVAESDPIAEYSETGLKQMPMMLALGVDSATLRATMTIAPPAPVSQ